MGWFESIDGMGLGACRRGASAVDWCRSPWVGGGSGGAGTAGAAWPGCGLA